MQQNEQDSELEYQNEEEMEEEESVGGKECGMCHDIPENIIYLSCDHIVCLVCAAKLILGNPTEDQQVNFSEVHCGLCNEVTVLSVEVQETLIEFLNQQEFNDEDEEEEEEEEGDEESQSNAGEGLRQIAHSPEMQNENEELELSHQRHQLQETQPVDEEDDDEESIRYNHEEESKNDSVVMMQRSGANAKPKCEMCIKPDLRKKVGENLESQSELNSLQRVTRTSQRGEQSSQKSVKKTATSAAKQLSSGKVHSGHGFKKVDVSRTQNESSRQEMQEDEEYEEEEEASGMLGSFMCSRHPEEEYTYYDPETKNLYCSQCLISEGTIRDNLSGIKSLKKCLPEILRNFHDMLNQVEVTKSLLENKRKDFEIRKEGVKVQAASQSKKMELAYDELLDFVQEQKMKSLKALEDKNDTFLNELEGKEQTIEERIGFLSEIVDEVNGFREKSQSPEEELFLFFFANQNRINSFLEEDSNSNANSESAKINKVFEDFVNKTKQEQLRQNKIGQEAIRDRINKNISLANTQLDVKEESVKECLRPVELVHAHSSSAKKTISRPINSMFTLGEAENSNLHNSKKTACFEQTLQMKPRLNTFTTSETYNQFVEKVKALPSKQNSSFEMNNYLNQTRAYSRDRTLSGFPGDSTGFSNTGYYKTISKNNYNIEKKMELVQKMSHFDPKNQKNDIWSGGLQNLGPSDLRSRLSSFQPSSLAQKMKLESRGEPHLSQNSTYNSSFRNSKWMFGK